MKKEKIENILIKIGIPASVKGFRYIEQILMLIDTPEWSDSKWIPLYEEIGRRNGTTGNRVERAIRHALQRAKNENNEYAAYYLQSNYNNNSTLLKVLYTRIKNEEGDEEKCISEKTEEKVLEEIIKNALKKAISEIIQEHSGTFEKLAKEN